MLYDDPAVFAVDAGGYRSRRNDSRHPLPMQQVQAAARIRSIKLMKRYEQGGDK